MAIYSRIVIRMRNWKKKESLSYDRFADARGKELRGPRDISRRSPHRGVMENGSDFQAILQPLKVSVWLLSSKPFDLWHSNKFAFDRLQSRRRTSSALPVNSFSSSKIWLLTPLASSPYPIRTYRCLKLTLSFLFF